MHASKREATPNFCVVMMMMVIMMLMLMMMMMNVTAVLLCYLCQSVLSNLIANAVL